MQLSEYNDTKNNIESMIHSSEVLNCEMACEILKGLEIPNGMKVDFIEPIYNAYLVMAKGLISIGSEVCLNKALVLHQKMGFLNAAIGELIA